MTTPTRRIGGINVGAVLILLAIIIFVLSFFGIGPDSIWLIGLALWASASLVG